MNIIESLFYIVPLTSALCNLFLLLTFLSAKKDSLIRSFMNMLICFTTWTLGSFFMCISLYPGDYFWFQVSMISILLVPICIYNFLYHYTQQTASFTFHMLNGASIFIALLNLADIFIVNPHITITETGQHIFTYEVSFLAVIPVALAMIVLANAARIVYSSIKQDGLPFSMFKPLMIGVVIMFIALIFECIPVISEIIPLDQFACLINAIILYYTLYRQHIFSLTQLTSSGSTYLVSTVLTSLILASAFQPLSRFLKKYFASYANYHNIAVTMLVSVITILVFNLLKRLMNNLFIKPQEQKENALRDFSISISKTLKRNEILSLFCDMIQEYTEVQTAYIFLSDSSSKEYQMKLCTDKMRSTAVTVSEQHPLIAWLKTHKIGIEYSDFKHTVNYKSMWENEKQIFTLLNTQYVLPISLEEELIGFVVLAEQSDQKPYSYDTINFMESITSIVSMALRNSTLYEMIQEEARLDDLTGIYNRRYFTKNLEELFKQWEHDSISIVLINFDDFHLYNELYGSNDGDEVLVAFANILKTAISSKGLIGRYSGKEFCIALPLCGTDSAEVIVDDLREKLNCYLNSSEEITKRFLTFSAGISAYPSSATNVKQLLTYANMAVYAAKKSGKNKTIVYSDYKHTLDDSALSYAHMEAIGHEYAPTIYALTAAIDAKDHYTFSHSVNVSYLATQLARAIGLDDEHVEIIRQAGLLHDIGKISIPENILAKTTPLTDEEYEIMKSHVENSIAMIRHLPSLDYVVPIAISHHERYDGGGYPRGLSGENIPIGGRCLAIADAFDAIVSKRPYKEAISIPEALEEIERNLGKQFDSELGRTFIELVKSDTIGTEIYE